MACITWLSYNFYSSVIPVPTIHNFIGCCTVYVTPMTIHVTVIDLMHYRILLDLSQCKIFKVMVNLFVYFLK